MTYTLINIKTNTQYTIVETIEEAVALCEFFGNLRFSCVK